MRFEQSTIDRALDVYLQDQKHLTQFLTHDHAVVRALARAAVAKNSDSLLDSTGTFALCDDGSAILRVMKEGQETIVTRIDASAVSKLWVYLNTRLGSDPDNSGTEGLDLPDPPSSATHYAISRHKDAHFYRHYVNKWQVWKQDGKFSWQETKISPKTLKPLPLLSTSTDV